MTKSERDAFSTAGYHPELDAYDGNLFLLAPLFAPDWAMYFLDCAWCGFRVFWSFGNTSPEMWVATDEYLTYPFDPWVCDRCAAVTGKRGEAMKQYQSYDDYLKSGHWRTIKSLALQRSRNKCQLCSAKSALQVHHNTYERLGSEQPEDVIVLCDKCHTRHHRELRENSEAQ